MTIIYNRKTEKVKRRTLRNNMTEAERLLWSRLRKRQIRGKRFLRQYSIEKYVIDFYCPKLKFAIEVDGEIHSLPEESENDKDRQTRIENYGVEFMRIKNEEVLGNIDEVVLRIEKMVDGYKNPSPCPGAGVGL